jgi:hypothetical protein
MNLKIPGGTTTKTVGAAFSHFLYLWVRWRLHDIIPVLDLLSQQRADALWEFHELQQSRRTDRCQPEAWYLYTYHPTY